MGNFTKNQQRREIMKVNVERAKQSTLDDVSFQFNIERTKDVIKPSKAILINQITDVTKEDELLLKVEFSLLPSKKSFSKINLDLYFQEQMLHSTTISIPQSTLLNDTSEFPQILDMKGVGAGEYQVRVEMYEPWSSGEKLSFTSKEITIKYVPQTRALKLVKIPAVRCGTCDDLTIVSSTATDIYRDMEQDAKKESITKRDEW